MRPPVIEDIDLSEYPGSKGKIIRLTAKDDVSVAQVWFVIKNSAGAALEEGLATQLNRGLTWLYAVQQDSASGQIVHIEAMATDRAGNSAIKRVPHLVAVQIRLA